MVRIYASEKANVGICDFFFVCAFKLIYLVKVKGSLRSENWMEDFWSLFIFAWKGVSSSALG